MSIEDLCQGSVVVKQVETAATGSMMGVAETYADGDAIDCLVQLDEREELPDNSHAVRGQRRCYMVFFSSDVSLSETNLLKWTASGNRDLATPIYLRVLGYYSQGRPDEDLLWIAKCEMLTSRPEV